MKLFISNKELFDNSIPESSQVHKLAFNELRSSIISKQTIPLFLSAGDASFKLVTANIEKTFFVFEFLG